MNDIMVTLRRQLWSLTSETRILYGFLEFSAIVDVILDGDTVTVRARVVTILDVNPRDPPHIREVAESLHREIEGKMSRYGTCTMSRDLIHHLMVCGNPMRIMDGLQMDMIEVFRTSNIVPDVDLHYKDPDKVLKSIQWFVRMVPSIMILAKTLMTTSRRGWLSDATLDQLVKNLSQDYPERGMSDLMVESLYLYSSSTNSLGILRVSIWWYRKDPDEYERLLSELVRVKKVECSWVDSPGEGACTASRE